MLDPGSGTAGPPSEALLRVSQLAVNFGPVRALDGVDLEVRAGEVVALAGENGAGKSTLVRCIAGDVTPTSGQVLIDGRRLPPVPGAATALGVAVAWQDPALCDNLDVASNLLLGREQPRLLLSYTRFHAQAASLLADLGIPLPDTTRNVRELSGGQRQLLAVARAIRDQPRLLVLDEPTSSLGVSESAQVEQLMTGLGHLGTTLVLVTHDVDQMFRLANRIAVLRQGRLVADVDPAIAYPDDVVAWISGQQVDSSARRQLDRLHGLVDRLNESDPSSSLALILSALGGALGVTMLCVHLVDGPVLRLAASQGVPPALLGAWAELPIGPGGGPFGLVAARQETLVERDIHASGAWARWRHAAASAGMRSSWTVPVMGPDGPVGVITLLRGTTGGPERDELDLVALYAGYAAAAVERERLLGEVTARNRVLETIREVLETLAGPVPLAKGLVTALQALAEGLGAGAVMLTGLAPGGQVESWVAGGEPDGTASEALRRTAATVLGGPRGHGTAVTVPAGRDRHLAVTFATPEGAMALVADLGRLPATPAGSALIQDAANSLRLALERAESERAHQQASALRRSQQLQRGFLSRLSHELRTPLTAIRGYASSLMQSDVTWDDATERRFLSRVVAESARLGRLVDDLLDFSAIESGILRLQQDWCDLRLVLDAAAACLPPASASLVEVSCPPDLPAVWADHDRLEQVFVNLMDNALRHNPPGTWVRVQAATEGPEVVVTVTDNGVGTLESVLDLPYGTGGQPRRPTAGAGLGLSITKGIVDAHGGRIEREPATPGTEFRVYLPVDRTPGPAAEVPLEALPHG